MVEGIITATKIDLSLLDAISCHLIATNYLYIMYYILALISDFLFSTQPHYFDHGQDVPTCTICKRIF